jgi:hypothetical protein
MIRGQGEALEEEPYQITESICNENFPSLLQRDVDYSLELLY